MFLWNAADSKLIAGELDGLADVVESDTTMRYAYQVRALREAATSVAFSLLPRPTCYMFPPLRKWLHPFCSPIVRGGLLPQESRKARPSLETLFRLA